VEKYCGILTNAEFLRSFRKPVRLWFVFQHRNLAGEVPEFDIKIINELLCDFDSLFIRVGLDHFEPFKMSVFSYKIRAVIGHK
jgi:hypothetical protein